MRKNKGFYWIALGWLATFLKIIIPIPVSDTPAWHLQILPETVGYILIVIGLLLLKKEAAPFKVSAIFALLGLLSTVAILAPLESNVWKIVAESVLVFMALGCIWFYLAGVRRMALAQGKDFLATSARAYQGIFLVLKLLGLCLNTAFRWQGQHTDPSTWLALGVSLFGVVNYIMILAMFFVSIQANGLKFSVCSNNKKSML